MSESDRLVMLIIYEYLLFVVILTVTNSLESILMLEICDAKNLSSVINVISYI